jgi:hypothetical protein
MLPRPTTRFWIWLAGVLLPIPSVFLLTTLMGHYDLGLMEICCGLLAGLAVCSGVVFTAKLSVPTKFALLIGTVFALVLPILVLYAILVPLGLAKH